ncbi:hypothetical protein AB0N05_37715 [Nocardia sp. NPDC051030]|uniref:hypothetical protein n=1 Tax=Nocardia sp. NPDC051030 TaxID=3155162 RepID=UPI00341FD38F
MTTAILGVVTVMMFMGLLQAILYFHARSIAIDAGEEALKQAASQYGNVGTGTAAAYAFIGATNAGAFQAPVVVVSRGATNATVDVTGKPPSLVWIWHPIVHIHLERPVERITIPGVPTS